MSSPRRAGAERSNTLTRSLLTGAHAQWLHSGLRFISTAGCQPAHVSYLSKTKGPLCLNVGVENLPQQLPFTFQGPRRGAEQLRFFRGGQWSVKTSKANQASIQVNMLGCTPAVTGCFDHEVHASVSFCSLSVAANGGMEDEMFGCPRYSVSKPHLVFCFICFIS